MDDDFSDFSDPANWHPIEEHPYLNDPPKVTPIPDVNRSDDLRTRIAAVLCAHPDLISGKCHGIENPDEQFSHQDEWAAHVADVLIRELGLKRRSSFISADDRSRIEVSEWDRSQMKTPGGGLSR